MANRIPPVQPGHHIVFEGDSITSRGSVRKRGTWPYLRLIHCERTWADVFADLAFCWCPERDLRFSTTAVGGSSCRAIADRYDEAVRPLKPDWVLMTTGGNDVRLEIEPAEFGGVLGAYARRAHEDSGAQTVFVSGWCEAADRPAKMQNARIDPYYRTLAGLADQLPFVHWLDLREAMTRKAEALRQQWSGHTLFSGPDGHYNEVGATVIAGLVLAGLGLIDLP
jgi:lysophospholipase L1-like esterase